MKNSLNNFLIAFLTAVALVACGGNGANDGTGTSPVAQSKRQQAAATCDAAWDASAIYNAGARISDSGVNYLAAYWTQNQNPSTHNGPSGSGQPWIPNGACGNNGPGPGQGPTPGPANIVSGAVYTLINLNSGKALDVAGAAKADGTPVQIWDDNGTQAQQWQINSNGDGTYSLINVNSNKALDVKAAGVAPGTKVQIWTQNGTGAQKWTFNANNDGTVTLINSNSKDALDVAAAGTADGTLIQIWTPNGTGAQKWTLRPVSTPPPGWTLDWSDEFNGNSLDGSKWTAEVSGNGEGNAELEYYTARPENLRLDGNGHLIIEARNEVYSGPDGTKPYTSGRINTKAKFSQAFGRIEASIKMPTGQGLWPAFWMLGANIDQVGWPKCGEIDIMEHINSESVIHGTIHWANAAGAHVQYGMPSGNIDTTQFHLYAVEWDTAAIRWYVDGNKYLEANIQNGINNTGAFQQPFFIILNLAVGGNWPGNPNGSVAFPQQMIVDYVRVYHR